MRVRGVRQEQPSVGTTKEPERMVGARLGGSKRSMRPITKAFANQRTVRRSPACVGVATNMMAEDVVRETRPLE
jgi:hypothetical protein